jgi:hypothetical protein
MAEIKVADLISIVKACTRDGKIESVGQIAKLLIAIGTYFSKEEYRERVEDSLIGTADSLVYWASDPKKKDGSLYDEGYVKKKIAGYCRKYSADRKKLK